MSGGCIEGAVAKIALEVLASGEAQLHDFGVSNEDAWEVGLSCGGAIRVFIEPHLSQGSDLDRQIWSAFSEGIGKDTNLTLITKLNSTAEHGLIHDGGSELCPQSWPTGVVSIAEGINSARKSELFSHEGDTFFAHCVTKPNHLIVIGAAHLSTELVQIAQVLGFKITVIDPRGLFTESLRKLCSPDQLHRAWPAAILPDLALDDQTYAALLTHDPKIDDQAMQILLRSPVKYIGALGSSRTHSRRVARLAEAGFTTSEIDRIHGPIGLDISAQTPAEIAVSIVAEITKTMHSE